MSKISSVLHVQYYTSKLHLFRRRLIAICGRQNLFCNIVYMQAVSVCLWVSNM